MDEKLRQRCELLIQNRDDLRSQIGWQNALLYPICSNIYVQREKRINCNKIKECQSIIKSNTGILSNFRGTSNLVIATLLSLEDNPEEKFSNVLKIYDALKTEFRSSAYLPLTAMMIADMQDENVSLGSIVKKAKVIYKGIKEQHPMITSSEDCSMVSLLALSERSESQLIIEVERCYELLKPHFFSANAVQALSFVLALSSENPKVKCIRALEIYQQLKEENCKYGSGFELAILGVLAMQDINLLEVTKTIKEINEFLLASKGFGRFGIGRAQRMMYASMLMMYDLYEHKYDSTINTAAVTSITSAIIAQQVAICAAVSVACVSSNATD